MRIIPYLQDVFACTLMASDLYFPGPCCEPDSYAKALVQDLEVKGTWRTALHD